MDNVKLTSLVGQENTISTAVTESLTACSVGSGADPVFSTPSLAALFENAAYTMLLPYLEDGQCTVGTAININHTSASPLGAQIKATVRITAVEGRFISFEGTAWDNAGEIGNCSHTRCVLTREKFLNKAYSKLS